MKLIGIIFACVEIFLFRGMLYNFYVCEYSHLFVSKGLLGCNHSTCLFLSTCGWHFRVDAPSRIYFYVYIVRYICLLTRFQWNFGICTFIYRKRGIYMLNIMSVYIPVPCVPKARQWVGKTSWGHGCRVRQVQLGHGKWRSEWIWRRAARLHPLRLAILHVTEYLFKQVKDSCMYICTCMTIAPIS